MSLLIPRVFRSDFRPISVAAWCLRLGPDARPRLSRAISDTRGVRAHPVSVCRHRSLSSSAPAKARYTRFGAPTPTPSGGGGSGDGGPEWNWGGGGWYDTRNLLYGGLGIGSAGYVYVHLERMPETGRLRFMNVSPRREAALAAEAYATSAQQYASHLVPPAHPVTQHVRSVVTRILAANGLGRLSSADPGDARGLNPRLMSRGDPEEYMWGASGEHEGEEGEREEWARAPKEWHLLVVDDPKMVNAQVEFGTITVFTGILPVVGDEQGLAAVLGHEIGHAVARHAAERVSMAFPLLLLAVGLQLAGFDYGIVNWGIKLLVELPFSRGQESEADAIGLRLAARACYEPAAAVTVQERLGALERKMGGLPGFLSTHPSSDKRVKTLEDLVPDALALRAASPSCARTADARGAFARLTGLGTRRGPVFVPEGEDGWEHAGEGEVLVDRW